MSSINQSTSHVFNDGKLIPIQVVSNSGRPVVSVTARVNINEKVSQKAKLSLFISLTFAKFIIMFWQLRQYFAILENRSFYTVVLGTVFMENITKENC